MIGKKILAALLFLVGGVLSVSARTNFWDGYPFWVWQVVLFVALVSLVIAVILWCSDKPKDETK